jgi:hypothetical protein
MYPSLQYERRHNLAGLAANPRQATMSALAALRDGSTLPDPDVLAALGLEALGCVLRRRRGEAPSPAQAHRYMEALANNVPLRRTLKEAAAALLAAGVHAIVYKGQDYLARIYGDLGARSMADVDLLVREQDLGAAEQALIDAGFIADADCKLMHERKFCKDGVAIDLHHALLQEARMRIEHSELFARAIPSSLAPGLLAFEATDALLVHCVNQTVKGYSLPASSYLELQALLAQADMGEAVRRGARYQMFSALYTSLAALGELGHARAARWAERVPMPRRRKLALRAIVVRFALGAIARETPSRATMLALKATLIDDPIAVLRFVPEWVFWQTPLKAPRALARGSAPAVTHDAIN